MKLTVDAADVNIAKRIEQFEKYSKSGSLREIGHENRYIEFREGKPVSCRFDGHREYEKVFESFVQLRKGRLSIELEDDKLLQSGKSIPYLVDYLIIDEKERYREGNRELTRIFSGLKKSLQTVKGKKGFDDCSSIFIRYSKKNVGLFRTGGYFFVGIFSSKSTYTHVKNKVEKLFS